MHKLTRLFSLSVVAFLLFSFVACDKKSNDVSSETSSLPAISSEIASPESSSVSTPTTATGTLADNWDSYQISIDGVIYTLPFLVSELEANGWVLESGYEGAVLPANSRAHLEYYKDGAEIGVSISNSGTTAKPYNECFSVSVDVMDVELKGILIMLPGGIALGSTPEEIVAAYGEANSEYIMASGDLGSYSYKTSSGSLELGFDDGELYSITLQNK